MKFIDDLLDKITMYRLVVYSLLFIAAMGLFSRIVGAISTPVLALSGAFVITVGVCYASDKLFGYIMRIPRNNESWLITALIIFLIMPPASTGFKAIYLAMACIIAMSSKYLLTIHRHHIFNPAAFAAFTLGLVGLFVDGVIGASWWVGNSALWPICLLLGVLILRKTRRLQLFIIFATCYGLATFIVAQTHSLDIGDTLKNLMTTSPLIFMGTTMLTEPATMPARKNQRLIFGGLVGTLAGWHPSIGSFFVYPETALIIGNVYAAIVSPRPHYTLKLQNVQWFSDRVANFVFTSSTPVRFKPGQYVEWTLGHKSSDSRGNRRSFTIASSPNEKEIHLGVKFYDPPSSFKSALHELNVGDTIELGNITGDFLLPPDPNRKIVMIAGGIGITPFRSMLQDIIDHQQQRNIILYYSVAERSELAYQDVLVTARAYGVRTIPIAPGTRYEKLDAELIKASAPDIHERMVYISGPHAMVEDFGKEMRQLGCKHIITDHFSGY